MASVVAERPGSASGYHFVPTSTYSSVSREPADSEPEAGPSRRRPSASASQSSRSHTSDYAQKETRPGSISQSHAVDESNSRSRGDGNGENGDKPADTGDAQGDDEKDSKRHNRQAGEEDGGNGAEREREHDEQKRAESPETVLASPAHRPSTPHFDLANYPTADLLRLLASLLQQIASANDLLRPDMDDMEEDHQDEPPNSGSRSTSRSGSRASSTHPNQPIPSPTTALFQDQPPTKPSHARTSSDPTLKTFSASRTSLAHPSSLLSFHARHIPSISIEAYLLRILKYCPTTNEVFLGLLVYFDRMSRLGTPQGVTLDDGTGKKGVGIRGFAIDSFNVHRLVIAGVTVASKFFSGEHTISLHKRNTRLTPSAS